MAEIPSETPNQPELVETTIPDGDEYAALHAALAVLKKYFPDQYKLAIGDEARMAGWIKEIGTGTGRDADQIRDDIFKHIVGASAIAATLGVTEATANKIIAGRNDGGMNFGDALELPKVQQKLGIAPDSIPKAPDTPQGAPGTSDADPNTLPGVLKGGTTIRVNTPQGQRWYQVYEFPPGSGQFVSYQFSDQKQAEAALGQGFDFVPKSETWYNAKVVAESQSEEVVGLSGNWGSMMTEIQRDAAIAAGVRDPSLIGRMMSDPSMQRILAQATVGDWTPEQILAEQRKTGFWQNTLYPGIKNFYGRTTEPEKAWNNYVGNVQPSITSLGYKQDADGTYNSVIKRMLDAGIDAQIFAENAPVFQQAIQNKEFFAVYKARVQAELGKDIGFGEWFSVLKGEASPELMKVAEGATVAYAAKQSDFALGEAQLQRLIAERDMSGDEAKNVFSEVNQAVLALGDAGLKRGGLSRDDILSAAAGIAPTSSMSADQVRLKVAKIAQENDLFDEEKIQFYVGFKPSGEITRPGLGTLAPEGA
jgi:hypothetical protein